jgi:hypothetical protein
MSSLYKELLLLLLFFRALLSFETREQCLTFCSFSSAKIKTSERVLRRAMTRIEPQALLQ